MAQSVNEVTLLGNVGSDPEVRTAGSSRVANLSLATSRSWKDNKGEWQEKTMWHRLTFWNKERGHNLADLVQQRVKKGDRLYIKGEIEYREWEDLEGQKKYGTSIIVREMIILSSKSKPTATGPGADAERAMAFARSGQNPSVPGQGPGEGIEDVPRALREEDGPPPGENY